MPSNETTLHFIKAGEFDGGCLGRAFESAKSKELDVQVVSATTLLQQGVDEDKVVFITDEFTGDVYELLLAHEKRIFGPICVLQCLQYELPLPNTVHPVCSLAMSGTTVSCTNVAKSVRDKLKQHIEYMNGNYQKNFTSEVTHLVAGEVGSEKYATAANLKTPIVLPSWVEDAWQHTQNDHQFSAKDATFVDEHRCPIFKGCTVCVTGLDGRRRNEIKRLVEKHGGQYSAQLKLKKTTHLLVEKPVGQKYQFATRWSMHCVNPDWLFDCINAGCWVEETPYLVKSDADPNSTCDSSKVQSLHSVTTVDATVNTTVSNNEVSRKATLAAEQSAASYGSKDLLNESRQSSLARVKESGLKSLHKLKHGTKCDYNVPLPSGVQFLDGCSIYLTGFNESQLDYLQKIINAGGATRFNQINPSVSHVVVGDNPEEDIERLVSNSELSPQVVTVHWLLESCRQVKCLPEQEYYCFESNDMVEDEPKKSEVKQKKEKEKVNDVDNDDILNQYLMEDYDLPPAIEEDRQQEVRCKQNVDNSDGKMIAEDMNSTNDVERGFLHGLTFCLDGYTEEQEAQLQTDIENFGGHMLSNSSKTIADYLVVPLNYECGEHTATTVVTFCWLESCAECSEILEPSAEFLFTPFALPEDVFPLQDCVISLSRYTEPRREHLMHLIEVLGGHCQEYFSRKVHTNVQANTQLILEEPVGSKYDAAVKWNIPAVTADWLYECARAGRKVPEAPYMVSSGKSQGIEEDEEGQLEDKTSDVFNDFTVPEGSGGKESDRENGDELKVPISSQERKDEETALNSSKQALEALILKVPPFFGKPKRPTYDLTDALEVLQSPCASSGSSSAHSRLSRGSRNSFLMDDYIQEHLQAALKNTAYPLGPHNNDQEHEGSSVDKEDHSEEKGDASLSESSSSYLRGVVLAVSKKCAKQLSDLHSKATSVGAECRDTLDKTCTHFIHEGRLTKEHNQAKAKGVHVVSPYWLYHCVEQQCRLDETAYPAGYNPKLTLSVVKTRRSTRSNVDVADDISANLVKVKTGEIENTSPDGRNLEVTQKDADEASAEKVEDEFGNEFTMDDLKASELGQMAGISQSSAQSDSLRTKEELQQIHDLMQSMKSSRRRSTRLRNSGNSVRSRKSSGNSRSSSRLRSLRSTKDDSDEEDAGPAMDVITYDDPKSRQERERIIAQLEDDASQNPETNVDDDKTIVGHCVASRLSKSISVNEEVSFQRTTIKSEVDTPTSPVHSCTPTAPPIALHINSKSHLPEPVSLLDPAKEEEEYDSPPRETPKFLLSTMSQQEKIHYSALIEDLGGVVFDSQFFNPDSRHTIAGQINRNEKCLSSIAAGNWLLRKSYLEACRAAGGFVEEQPHEWGVEIPGEVLSNLALASRRWRIELNTKSLQYKTKIGAFQDWKVLLCVEESRVASFGRVLKAGGADVLGTKPPFQDIAHATHALISNAAGQVLVNNINFDRLEQSGILVLKTDYIAEYLSSSLEPDASKYVFRPKTRLTTTRKRKNGEDFSGTPGKRKRDN